MLSDKSGSHDTLITLFQEIPAKKEMKSNRSKVNLTAVKTLSKLTCQKLVPFSTDKTLALPEPFIAETETYNTNEKKNDNQLKKFLWSCLRGDTDTNEIDLPSWARTQALLFESELPQMHVAFLPFLPQPVTVATV